MKDNRPASPCPQCLSVAPPARSSPRPTPPRPAQVSLTSRIRSILADYPEGTSILKELFQNADDAGARRVALCLDHRAHGGASVAFPGLAPFQGPALLAYNDAAFTEADFESISRIGAAGEGRGWGQLELDVR